MQDKDKFKSIKKLRQLDFLHWNLFKCDSYNIQRWLSNKKIILQLALAVLCHHLYQCL